MPNAMTTLFISSLLLLTLLVAGMLWAGLKLHYHIVDGLRADNKDLKDRLFQKNALPPSGVDLTEKYEEKQERERIRREDQNPPQRPKGPLQQLTKRWTESDRSLVERRNIDATRGRVN